MFRVCLIAANSAARFPHKRGDVPLDDILSKTASGFSPQAWGCSEGGRVAMRIWPVFPTSVGMFRTRPASRTPCRGFPHKRGDVPAALDAGERVYEFSPQAWGCSGGEHDTRGPEPVFPTSVGMFLRAGQDDVDVVRFPHKRGDVPLSRPVGCPLAPFSPQAWGCSVAGGWSSSPPMVFPTSVGMFRWSQQHSRRRECFPHKRGDVPFPRLDRDCGGAFSPQAWGCSGRGRGARQAPHVFPTSVGMFLVKSVKIRYARGFPHKRGDVPNIRYYLITI